MFARAVMPIRAFLDRGRRQLAEIPLDSAYQFSIKSRPLSWIAYWFTLRFALFWRNKLGAKRRFALSWPNYLGAKLRFALSWPN